MNLIERVQLQQEHNKNYDFKKGCIWFQNELSYNQKKKRYAALWSVAYPKITKKGGIFYVY